ncbi:glycosyltransferase family 9 protein [Flavobacterium silvaticum]|uniref:Glycosyltransferase family 9 protein n=1 Tax=Flavobacterium silvaticum TaxID=1852020 RepID=A0A972FN47_9FLAO|nr:glycosyltransferase family 9 protein [Flavobacterium silvaticum]NMH28300.1 hypothetical protein [Flavobacterium silvaticum]
MKHILFLHDTDLSLRRGAELTLKQLISLGESRGFRVSCNSVQDFDDVKQAISISDFIIVSSTSRCPFETELIRFLIDSKKPYAKLEFDHNFCARRTIYCTVDPRYKNCCETDKFHAYRELSAGSKMNFFQSPKHYENHKHFYGEAIGAYQLMPPTVEVDLIQDNPEKQEHTIPYFGELSLLKGGNAFVDYAIENPQRRFEVYGKNKLQREIPQNVFFMESVPNEQVLEILGKSKYFFCQPYWPEPSGRLAAEAWLSGCEIIANDRVGTFSYDFYPNDKQRAIREMEETPGKFWDTVEGLIPDEPASEQNTLGNVLVRKSYGGLGDIFFVIPSLIVLKSISDKVTFAVEKRLVDFLQANIPDLIFIDRNEASNSDFDRVIELGNCPAFGRREYPEQLDYVTHKKVKQHAIGHYADAIAKMHPNPSAVKPFPYFNRTPDFENPYYTIHPGAGFLLKIWPTEKYAQLIQDLHKEFPGLRCKVIVGPDDPNPVDFMQGQHDYIDLVTGGIEDVGNAMSKALFHIGNDAGITHVAGAYNVPSVGIYGPTGPGAWGCFSEQTEIVWGKPGNCELRCNYEVILACEHRVCLSSTTSKMVMGAVFKLLQKTYPELGIQKVINPSLIIEKLESGCGLTIDNSKFDLEFTNEFASGEVYQILSGDFSDASKKHLRPFVDFLSEQKIILDIPSFPK